MAKWGDRPNVDNWRSALAIENIRQENKNKLSDDSKGSNQILQETPESFVGALPQTKAERDSIKITNHTAYLQLGMIYKEKFNSLIGKKVDTIELFPASEGFYAFQDSQNKEELLLILNAGIFYEFIKDEDFRKNNINRISIDSVELNTNYVLIISSNAGLWGYNTGDTIQFKSFYPHRIIVTGRINQYLSAFGEHVIVKEIEQAIQKAIKETGLLVNEFTVAPRFKSNQESACHEWFVEFETKTNSTKNFVQVINQELMSQNKYYKDLIEGNIISNPVVTCILKGGFKRYMQHIGKLGGCLLYTSPSPRDS